MAYGFSVSVLIREEKQEGGLGMDSGSMAKTGHLAMDQEGERTLESGAGITCKALPLAIVFCQRSITF